MVAALALESSKGAEPRTIYISKRASEKPHFLQDILQPDAGDLPR